MKKLNVRTDVNKIEYDGRILHSRNIYAKDYYSFYAVLKHLEKQGYKFEIAFHDYFFVANYYGKNSIYISIFSSWEV